MEKVEGCGAEGTVDGLALVRALAELFELFQLFGWFELFELFEFFEWFELFEFSPLFCVCLVDELGFACALLEVMELFELALSVFGYLVDGLYFMTELLEFGVRSSCTWWASWTSCACCWSCSSCSGCRRCLVRVRWARGAPGVGVFLGLARATVGARSILMRCLLAPNPPCVAALRFGGRPGGEVALVRVWLSMALLPHRRRLFASGGDLVLPS